jgi:hypothetical protein
MKVDVSGARNGVPWPGRGETVDLPGGEAADLCTSGLAEPAEDVEEEQAVVEDDPETAVVPGGTETAVPDETSEQRGGLTTETGPVRRAPAKKAAAKKAVNSGSSE